MPIPLKTISHAVKQFAAIQKEMPDVSIEVEPENFWFGAENHWHFVPRYGNVSTIPQLAKICENTSWFVLEKSLTATSRAVPAIAEAFGLKNMAIVENAHASLIQSPVKYYYESIRNFSSNGFGMVIPMLLSGPPSEMRVGDKQYRVFSGRTVMTHGDGYVRDLATHDKAVFAVSTDSPYYNYLDQNHVVFFISKVGEAPKIFIANQLSLNVYAFAAAFSVASDKLLTSPLRNDVFLFSQNNAELHQAVGLLERVLPEKYSKAYNTLKQAIRADFESRAQNVIVTKFQRGEIKELTINNIKLSANKAVYETVSIEADNIADTILHKLDPNSVFDIYQLVDAYIQGILEAMSRVPRAVNTQGYAEAKQWNLAINGIPITVGLSITNTRRKVNNHYINAEELQRVLRRATCFDDVTMYNNFLREVERASLRVHDALSNGVPIKIFTFDSYSDYNKEVTAKHPKIFFTYVQGKYFLWLNKEKTLKVPLRRFVGMLDELKTLNVRTNNGWVSDDSGLNRRNTDWCKWKLKTIIRAHAISDTDACLVTDAQLLVLIDWLLEARTEAEKRSRVLLETMVTETAAVAKPYRGIEAYELKGNSGRVYAVEKESNKVWDVATGNYVCIVDGRGEMGIGYDALVARLLALKNDTFVVDKITTLRDPISRIERERPAAQPAPANA